MSLRRVASAGLALALVLGAAACSDDDDPATTSTTAPRDGETSSTSAAVTAPGETTTTAAPPVAGPEDLQALLLPPEQVGDGFALDPALGTGAFSGELCEDVTMDPTWDEQASQALTRAAAGDQELVTQAVLSFPDAAAAEAFVAALADALETCQPDGEQQAVDAGDEALLVETASGETSSSAGAVRVGAVVSTFTVVHPTAAGDPLTPDLLAAAGALLAP